MSDGQNENKNAAANNVIGCGGFLVVFGLCVMTGIFKTTGGLLGSADNAYVVAVIGFFVGLGMLSWGIAKIRGK